MGRLAIAKQTIFYCRLTSFVILSTSFVCILSIWQKETTSSHIRTAIKFEYFDFIKITFLIFP